MVPPGRHHRSAGAYPQPPIPPDEPQRLASLERYEVMDTDPEQSFDDLTLLAAHICETPIALVTLLDTERQWFKARIGLEIGQTARDVAFCAHAIAAPGTLVVPDAHADDRFAQNPLVLGDPNIRFYAGAPLRVPEGHALGTLCVIDRVPRQLTDKQLTALDALSRQVVAQLELRRRIRELRRFSVRDSLTTLFNRGYFDDTLPIEIERAMRYEDPVALMLVDIDRFKAVNDRHGHQQGDRVLAFVGSVLRNNVRAADVVCRYGGEEFAVILPHTQRDVAARLADRIREQITSTAAEVRPELPGGPLTVTIGVAAFPEDAPDTDGLIARADERLYAGKTGGRNRVVARDA